MLVIRRLGEHGSLARPLIGNTDAWTAECPAHPDFAQDLLIQTVG